jgi:hypothetical protein
MIFFLTKLFDQLVNFRIRQPLVAIIFKPIVSLDNELEQFLRRFEQLKLTVIQLLKVFLFQLVQTRLKNILLTGLMSQPHQQEQVIRADIFDHVLFEKFKQTLNLKVLDNGVVPEHFIPPHLNRYTIKTFQHILKDIFLQLSIHLHHTLHRC